MDNGGEFIDKFVSQSHLNRRAKGNKQAHRETMFWPRSMRHADDIVFVPPDFGIPSIVFQNFVHFKHDVPEES